MSSRVFNILLARYILSMHDLMRYCCYYVQLAYPGKLYITDNNSCFKSDVEDTTLILPHSDVTSAEKLPSSLDGGYTIPLCY